VPAALWEFLSNHDNNNHDYDNNYDNNNNNNNDNYNNRDNNHDNNYDNNYDNKGNNNNNTVMLPTFPARPVPGRKRVLLCIYQVSVFGNLDNL